PNYTSADAQHYKAGWAAYDVPRHLYHFSPVSMQQLMIRNGFQLQHIKPMCFDSFYVSMLSEKNTRGHNRIFKAFWIGLVSNIKAFCRKNSYSSQIYIARPAASL